MQPRRDRPQKQDGDRIADRADAGDDQNRNQAGDQGIFDRGRAAFLGGEILHKRSRSMGTSGKSAAGMG